MTSRSIESLVRRTLQLTLLALCLGTSLVFPQRLTAGEPQKATLGAGCFWCVEAIYERVDGVLDVVSGYAGGKEQNPTYENHGGHAEAVQITFDPDKVSFEKLLELFWKSHDPTNGTGVAPDFGRSYRPILFYHNDAQRMSIAKVKGEVQKTLSKPIATEIVPFEAFWPAEDYHQDFVFKNPNYPYVLAHSVRRLKMVGLFDHPRVVGKK